MTKAAIYTLGCKANQADSDLLAAELCRAGFEVVSAKEPADLYIINTCTVTGKAAYQSRQAVRRFIRRRPGAKVAVFGCDVVVEKEVIERIPEVWVVAGSKESLLKSLRSSKVLDAPFPMTKRARPFIKIQDGCENFCSYCIVPYVRGKLRSVPGPEVISTVEALSRQGYYEVVLTGIHIGAYGNGTGTNLKALLGKILNETDIPRVRLSSLEPDEIDASLIKLITESGGRICPHLHIPLQGGCDHTLEKMNRRYTVRQYKERIEEIRLHIPNCAIGADVITGFPGETDEEFEATYRFIGSLPLTYLHVFSYSDRKGTEAFDLPNKVPEKVKRERTKRLRQLSTEKRIGYLRSHLGKEVTVVFDRNKVDGYWKGVSENYINVLIGEVGRSSNHHRVRLTAIRDENMVGERI